MQLKDVMTQDVEVVHPESTLIEAAEKMQAIDVGSMPVCDGTRLVGMLTDRDITIRAVAQGYDPAKTMVRDVMTPGALYCFEDQDVKEAARLMQESQIRRLLVLSRDKQLVGIVSLGDLAVGTGDEKLAGETLERVSEPAGHQELNNYKEEETHMNTHNVKSSRMQSRDLTGRKTVAGLFRDRVDAERAIDDLKAAGFTGDQIGIALASAFGSVVAGTAVAGAGIGAAAGGLVGALVGMGIPEEEARYFERGFRSGEVLVTVKAGEGVMEALAMLEQNDADTGLGHVQRAS